MEAGKQWDSILKSAQRKRLVAKKFLSSKTSLNNRGEVSKDAIENVVPSALAYRKYQRESFRLTETQVHMKK